MNKFNFVSEPGLRRLILSWKLLPELPRLLRIKIYQSCLIHHCSSYHQKTSKNQLNLCQPLCFLFSQQRFCFGLVCVKIDQTKLEITSIQPPIALPMQSTIYRVHSVLCIRCSKSTLGVFFLALVYRLQIHLVDEWVYCTLERRTWNLSRSLKVKDMGNYKDVEIIHVLLDNPTWLSRVWLECACKNTQLCN